LATAVNHVLNLPDFVKTIYIDVWHPKIIISSDQTSWSGLPHHRLNLWKKFFEL